MTYYARLIARVSSDPQADKISPEEQIANSRAALPLLARQLGVEIVEKLPPLAVVQSTDLIDPVTAMADLRRLSREYDALCRDVETGQIHFVIGRDAGRVLGRTPELQNQLSSFFRLNGVQVYLYTQALPLIDPSTLDPRRRPAFGNQIAMTFGGIMAQEEIRTFVKRRRDGMEAHARAGRHRSSKPPFGYMRPVLGVASDGRPVYGAMVVDPTKHEQLHTGLRAYLEGADVEDLGITLYRALINPAVVGILTYNTTRRVARRDKAGRMRPLQTYIVTPYRRAELGEGFLRGIDERTEEERANGVMVEQGDWTPIFATPEEQRLWLTMQEERKRRTLNSLSKSMGSHPLSSLLVCGECGTTLVISRRAFFPSRNKVSSVYRCNAARLGQGCKQRQVHEEDLLEAVFTTIQWVAENWEEMTNRLRHRTTPSVKSTALLEEQVVRAERAIKQWNLALEQEEVSPKEWKKMIAPHREKLRKAQAELERLEREQHSGDPALQLALLTDLIHSWAHLVEHDPPHLGTRLRQLVEKIIVTDGEVSEVRFNAAPQG